MTEAEIVVDPRAEAQARLGGGFDARVLEPAPPTVDEGPWFADDPVRDGAGPGLPIVAPVPIAGAASTWDELARTDPDLASWCADRWLGAWHALASPSDLDALERTRVAWHTVAEHVIAPARYQANGKIGLRFTRGGFGTPFFDADRQLRVSADGLVVVRDDLFTTDPVTTVAAAARAAGIEPGAPTEVYAPVTAFDPDAPLDTDPVSARFLGDWFGFGASVLEELRAAAPESDTPGRVQLWPEHFDLSVDLGDEEAGRRATFGASPGDAAHPLPYAYVSPWNHQAGDFWNEDSFASLGLEAFVAVPDQRRAVLDFFDDARDRLGA